MRFLVGFIFALAGLLLGSVGISLAAKPSNTAISINPVDAFQTYFFSFSWAGGALGTLLGALLLGLYVSAWALLGLWVLRRMTAPRG